MHKNYIKLTFLVFANLLGLVRYSFKISIGRGSYIKGWVMGVTRLLYNEPWPVFRVLIFNNYNIV